MEDYESGETPLIKNDLHILAEAHDGIIASRTEEEIGHGNPEKGYAVMKLKHAARYLQGRKDDATDGRSNTGKTDKAVSS